MPPQTPPLKGLKDPKKRKMLIYAGVAGALLLMVLIQRRSSAQQQAAQQGQNAQPVTNPAVDPNQYYGAGSGGIDYSSQLATVDTDLQTLAQAVAAQQSGRQTPGGNGGFTPKDAAAWLAFLRMLEGKTGGHNKQKGPGNHKPKPPGVRPGGGQSNKTYRGGPMLGAGDPHGPPIFRRQPNRPLSRAYQRHG